LHGLTIIAFVGSVFSPYYFRARKGGMADPENHCAINVALYGRHKRWAMTERGLAHVTRTADQFSVGPSSMVWENGSLVITINERCAPLPFALRGRVIFTPEQIYDSPIMLDTDAKHFWQAVAPHGRIKVEMEHPALSWEGSAYHDMNWGDEALEQGFDRWNWCRSTTPNCTQVFYDVTRRDGTTFAFGRNFQNGIIIDIDLPARHSLSHGFWGMSRDANSETPPTLIATLEDAPFYTRNQLAITVGDERRKAIHESLSLKRFAHPIVQLMLPFRMPRRR
jgi:carotenoid 1,2-hydratase